MDLKQSRLKRRTLMVFALFLVACVIAACHPVNPDLPEQSTSGEANGSLGGESNEPYVGSLLPAVAKSTTLGNDASDGLSGPPADLGKGNTYYVSSSEGNDANDGLSEQTPFQTVAPINALTLKPGDNVLFKRGDVFEGVHMQLKGAGQARDGYWITLDAYGSGANPLLTAPAKASPAISLNRSVTTGGYRIRHIDIDGYVQGISVKRSPSEEPFHNLIISDLTIKNITLNKFHDSGDYSLLPGGAALAFGMWLYNVKDVTVSGITLYNTDCPIQVLGGNVTLQDLDICKSNMQGIMLYGAIGDLDYETVASTLGNIVLKDSRILHTGAKVGTWGSTGVLVENLHDCVIQNVEIAYTVNGLAAYDAVAVDWEQSNINCVIENLYAHDNFGAMVLAMEHGASEGNSRGNIIRNCVSVNNGLHGTVEKGTFIDITSYHNPEQAITIENCIDIGRPGSAPYSDGQTTSAKPYSKLKVENMISGELALYESFDFPLDGERFSVIEGYELANSGLILSKDTKLRTAYAGSEYSVSCYLQGVADLTFLSPDDQNGYIWSFEKGKVIMQKSVDGALEVIEELTVAELSVDEWYRVRIETEGDLIETYLDDRLICSVYDQTFDRGAVSLSTKDHALADLLIVCEYASATRFASDYEVRNAMRFGALAMSANWNETEQNWQPTNMSEWISRPREAGWGRIEKSGANISRETSMNVTGYGKVQLVLMNGTDSGKVRFEFSTDHGATWHGVTIDTAYAGADGYGELARIPFEVYKVDLGDVPEWTGEITNVRICFEGTSGQVAVKTVTVYK